MIRYGQLCRILNRYKFHCLKDKNVIVNKIKRNDYSLMEELFFREILYLNTKVPKPAEPIVSRFLIQGK